MFKITLAGTDAKAKYNEELVEKAGTVKRWCAGGGTKVGLALDRTGTLRVSQTEGGGHFPLS